MIVEKPSRIAEAMEWKWSKPTEQKLCVVDGKAREVELPRALGVQKILSGYQMQSTELFTLVKFGLL